MSIFRRNILKINEGGKINPNLLTGTRDFSGFYNLNGWTRESDFEGCRVYGKGTLWNGPYKEVNIKANKWYTFSFSVYTLAGMKFQAVINIYGTSADGLTPNIMRFSFPKQGRYNCQITFRSDRDRTIGPRVELNELINGDNWLQISQYKLEEGKKATPWCPNIND